MIVPCMCRSLAVQINNTILAKFGARKKVLLYTKDQPWKGEDVNVAWTDADVVIYSPTIDCGVSYEVPNHFKNVVAFLDGNSGATHETAAQMISRPRDAKLFLLCFAPTKCKIKQSMFPNNILKEFNAKGEDIRKSDIQFFGITGTTATIGDLVMHIWPHGLRRNASSAGRQTTSRGKC